MKRNQLLFVTYHDENFEEGLSYALDLAKTMNDGIEVLLLYKRKALEKFEDMMTAVTFCRVRRASDRQGNYQRGLQDAR